MNMIDAADLHNASNLTEITWAHAVDSQKFLSDVLQGDIDFIEADILLGFLENDANKESEIPIMAHPPATTSDLSLEAFLTHIQAYNTAVQPSKVKGVKLDFKSIGALEKSIGIIGKSYDMQKFPTWINADILPGPVNNTETIPVDPKRFFDAVKQLGPAVLSIGWTTKWSESSTDGQYTRAHVSQMINVIKDNRIDEAGNVITFPVRAGITAHSLESLVYLYCSVKETNPVTFTIWSSANDAVNVENLRKFIFTIGLDKVYVDVPDELNEQLRLNDNPFGTTKTDIRCNDS
ncbi:protein FAM151B isoform X2 [Ochlerotatus camptorhynchus]